MKLSRADAVNLNNLLATAAIAGIESIVIDNGFASGYTNQKTIFVSNSEEIPKLTQKIGLGRINHLRSRLDLVASNSDMYIDAKESDRGEISMLELISGKTKIQYRCMATSLIKAPKGSGDDGWRIVNINKTQSQLILNSVKVMGAKDLTLIIKKEGTIIFQISDAIHDQMTVELDNLIENIEEVDPNDVQSVIYKYETDVLLPLLRAAQTNDGEISFLVGAEGTVHLILNDHSIYVLQQMDTLA